MTLVVPFDGSELAEAALVRAVEFGEVFEESVLAVSVVPKGNEEYAVDRGWLEPDEPYELNAIVGRLHRQVTDLCPSANFRHVLVDRYAPAGTISVRLRNVARDVGASMVFVGSENAGQIVTSVASVGSNVATDDEYDVVIVRHRTPAAIARRRAAAPDETPPPGTDSHD